jgi:septum formation protein
LAVSAPAAVVLASASAARRRMLLNAGIAFDLDPAAIDEAAIKAEARQAGATAEAAALALARAKAAAVSARRPDAVVIGADQLLTCADIWYDKPADVEAAVQQLQSLCGRAHRLVSAAAVVRAGETLWQTVDVASLTMRPFSEAFLERYLTAMGRSVTRTVGAYQLEGPGIQLFERIDGDYFTILGMPLVPLLACLRELGVLQR